MGHGELFWKNHAKIAFEDMRELCTEVPDATLGQTKIVSLFESEYVKIIIIVIIIIM